MTSVDVASDSFNTHGGDAAGEERNADYLAGRHSAALCHRAAAGLVCRRTTAGRCVITCVLSRRYGGVRAAAELRIFQQQDIRRYRPTLLNENSVTRVTPLFYKDHPAREFCAVRGVGPGVSGRLWAEEGFSSLSGLRRDSPEQKPDVVRRCGGAVTGGELPFNPDTSAGARRRCQYVPVMRPCPPVIGTRARITRLGVPDWPGMYEQQGEPERTARTV